MEKNSLVNIKNSYACFKRGKMMPGDKASYYYLQNRTIFFWGKATMGKHRGIVRKALEHLATRCDRMLGRNYTRRLNERVDACIFCSKQMWI